jgi:peptide chain release factor
MWVQITAGQGPDECAWVVARLVEYLEKATAKAGLQLKRLQTEEGTKAGILNSALLSLEGPKAENWIRAWEGTIQWTGQSPFRPEHKRKNWFVGVEIFAPIEKTTLKETDLHFESQRSGGPGGQNVNKVESAVRLTHLPTGLSVLAQEERTQYRNRQLALARLEALFYSQDQTRLQKAQQSRWQAHHVLERGNPVKIFRGPQFKLD